MVRWRESDFGGKGCRRGPPSRHGRTPLSLVAGPPGVYLQCRRRKNFLKKKQTKEGSLLRKAFSPSLRPPPGAPRLTTAVAAKLDTDTNNGTRLLVCCRGVASRLRLRRQETGGRRRWPVAFALSLSSPAGRYERRLRVAAIAARFVRRVSAVATRSRRSRQRSRRQRSRRQRWRQWRRGRRWRWRRRRRP